MNMIGFRKEHDERILLNSIYVNYLNFENKIVDISDNLYLRDKIIKYLQQGLPILNLTLWLFDDNNNSIDAYRIFTDGEWVWPSYFIYYLKKGEDQIISKDFLSHLQSKQFTIPHLNKPDRLRVDRFLFEKVLDIAKK